MFLPFVADILVFAPAEGRTDPYRVVMTGDAGMTCEESLDKALETIRRWYLAPSEANYPYARAIIHEQCPTCRGAGTVFTGKRPRRQVPCKACKGAGTWPVLETPVLRPEGHEPECCPMWIDGHCPEHGSPRHQEGQTA
jgi:hypothetical protein